MHASEPRLVCCRTGLSSCRLVFFYVLCGYLLVWSTFSGLRSSLVEGSGRLEPSLLVAILTISHCSQPAETGNQVLDVLGCVDIGRQKKKKNWSEADEKKNSIGDALFCPTLLKAYHFSTLQPGSRTEPIVQHCPPFFDAQLCTTAA